MSKWDSLVNIIHSMSPSIIVLCEIKHKTPQVIRTLFKKLNYNIIVRKETGILIASKTHHKLVECTASIHPNILTGRFTVKNNTIRIIAVYGLQESSPLDSRSEFFDELNTEIESCSLHEDTPIVVGDINAKIGLVNNTITDLSPNGKLLHSIIDDHSLKVVNFHPECSGKWTRVMCTDQKSEKSVIDYILTNSDLYQHTKSITIDEERLFTPFNTFKNNRVKFTDHNSIFTEFSWFPTRTLPASSTSPPCQQKPTALGWRLSMDGLVKFRNITKIDNIPQDNYDSLEDYIKSKMNSCFQPKKPPKTTNPNHIIQHKPFRKVFFHILKPLLSAGRLEKRIAREYITIIQKLQVERVQNSRANRINEVLVNIQNENGHFSAQKFWKMKKCIISKGDNKTSIITKNNVELFDDEAIINEYEKEFKLRLAHRKIIPSLQNYQTITHNLLDECINQAKKCTNEDFIPSEVSIVMNELKSGKSTGSDLLPPDIFKHAGTNLVVAITNILNNIKKNLIIPASWIRVIVVTLFKNKGSKKSLKNHRGIFLAAILSKVMEKLIKTALKSNLTTSIHSNSVPKINEALLISRLF